MFDRCIDCLTYDLSQIETLEKVLTVSAKIMVILVHTIRDRPIYRPIWVLPIYRYRPQ